MKKILALIGRVAAILSILIIFYELLQNKEQLSSIKLDVYFFGLFFWGVSAMIFSNLIGAVNWSFILNILKQQLRFTESIITIFISQLGKYLPGNFFHYIGRVGMAEEYGVPKTKTVLSMMVEVILLCFSCIIFILFGLIDTTVSTNFLNSGYEFKYFFELSIFSLIVISIVIKLLIAKSPQFNEIFCSLIKSPKATIFIVVSPILTYFAFGVFLHYLIAQLTGVFSLSILELSWGFAMAWLLGMLVPGAPGGIGIREAVFIGVFHSKVDSLILIEIVILLRCVTSVGDVLTYFLGILLKRYNYRLT